MARKGEHLTKAHRRKLSRLRLRETQEAVAAVSPIEDILDVLVGTLLGDSSLTIPATRRSNVGLVRDGTNCPYQKHLYELIKPYLRGEEPKRVWRKGRHKKFSVWSVRTQVHPTLTEWQRRWYRPHPSPKKTCRRRIKRLPFNLIEEHFSLRSLVYWIVDDGTRRDGAGFKIGTYAFTRREVGRLVALVNDRFGLGAHMTTDGCVGIGQDGARRLLDLMRREGLSAPPGMGYKFGPVREARRGLLTNDQARQIVDLADTDSAAALTQLTEAGYQQPKAILSDLRRGKRYAHATGRTPPKPHGCAVCGKGSLTGPKKYCGPDCRYAATYAATKAKRAATRASLPAKTTVRCRGCNFIAPASLMQHLRRTHGWSTAEYRARFGSDARILNPAEEASKRKLALRNLARLNGT